MMTKSFAPLLLVALILFFVPGEVRGQADADEQPVLRFGDGEDFTLDNVPLHMALAKLREQGYEIEITEFADNVFAIEALINGQLDFASTNFRTAWLAAGQGAGLVSVFGDVGMDYILVSTTEIESCDDWNGQTVAYNSPAALSWALGNYYFSTICPDATPDEVYITGSSNRAAALLSGAIGGAPLRYSTSATMLEEEPDKIHILVDFTEEAPWMLGSGLHVARTFAAEHPEAVADVVGTMLVVAREINEDPELLVAASVELMAIDAEEIRPIIEYYVSTNRFDPNGGLTLEAAERSLEFYNSFGPMPEELSVEDYIDLSYLELALNDLDSE